MAFSDLLVTPAATQLMEIFRRMADDMKVVADEVRQRRNLPVVGPLITDQHVVLTAPAGKAATFDLRSLYGRPGTAATVITADAGKVARVGINGSDPIPVVEGDAWDHYIAYTVRLDNEAGSGDLDVMVGLVVTKAMGGGAWASDAA